MQTPTVADNTEGLRYEKVMLATDVPQRGTVGMHPASRDNLRITYFFGFFEQLVDDGHLYVLETPLVRVRTGKSGSHQEKTIYCYSETERDNTVKKLGGKPACVAEADAENKAAEPSESKLQSTAQHTTARRRPEITRFKGLGEISPGEFKQFIGDNMRLSRVEHAPKPEVVPILDFYMGRNTPDRKDYIMERLVVPVEE